MLTTKSVVVVVAVVVIVIISAYYFHVFEECITLFGTQGLRFMI